MSIKESYAMDRMQWILTEEELARIIFTGNSDELMIRVDLHGLTCLETRRLIRNLIALIRYDFELLIIHGYRHGHALCDMLRNDFMSERVASRCGDENNPGVTLYKVA